MRLEKSRLRGAVVGMNRRAGKAVPLILLVPEKSSGSLAVSDMVEVRVCVMVSPMVLWMVGGVVVRSVVSKQIGVGESRWGGRGKSFYMHSSVSRRVTRALVYHAVPCERTEISMGTVCSDDGCCRVNESNWGPPSELLDGSSVISCCVWR
jgi:hypothetical protein